jgi:hypothetical protein
MYGIQDKINQILRGAETIKKNSMKTTDTPRTDAASFSSRDPLELLKTSQQLELELAASKAEVEHIKTLLKDIPAVHINTLRGNIATLSWDSYEHILGPHPCRDRAEKAEAEVAKLNHQLLKTESDLLQSQDINLFLDTEFRISCKRAEKAEAEVERLRSQLARSVEIAETACKYLDTGGWNEDEMYSGKEGWVTETEINEVCATLAALKSEIK